MTLPLSEAQISNAQAKNPVVFPKLQKTLGLDWPADTSSRVFAVKSAYLQQLMGLTVDGIFGPNTAKAHDADRVAPKPARYLIANGKRYEVDFPCVNYEQAPEWSLYRSGFRWRDGEGIKKFVLHWDVTLTSKGCLKVLVFKNVSVQLMLDGDPDATVYQALDLGLVRAHHGGPSNSDSVGCEINNPWYVKYQQRTGRPKINDLPVNGNQPVEHLDFFPLQKERTVQMVNVVSDIFGIPKKIPRGSDGKLTREVLPDLKERSGVVGHFHAERKKIDPGVELFDHLSAAGYQ
jgi:hypothetical protein